MELVGHTLNIQDEICYNEGRGIVIAAMQQIMQVLTHLNFSPR